MGFLKKSYPLPRDLAARTLCRYDVKFLNHFIGFSYQIDSLFALEQLIDLIGHIVYSHKTKLSSLKIVEIYENNRTEMVKYKIIRCLSGFNDHESKKF